jgi:hypothetical protein
MLQKYSEIAPNENRDYEMINYLTLTCLQLTEHKIRNMFTAGNLRLKGHSYKQLLCLSVIIGTQKGLSDCMA